MSYESEEDYNEAMSNQAYDEAENASDQAYAEHLEKANCQLELTKEEQREPIVNALYATKRFLTTDATHLAECIIEYLSDAGFAIARKTEEPPIAKHLKACLKE